MERYFLEPYRFIPPFRGTFWCNIFRRIIPRQVRKKFGVRKHRLRGLEHLTRAYEQGAGVLLAPNHSCWADPLVVSLVGIRLKRYFYYVASYHLFRQSRFTAWVMNRIGAYSIWREGADRESIKATTRILAEAERPVVLFPEGTWFRQNDRVGPLQDGLSLITRQAARNANRPVVVLPVGLKYWYLGDPTAALVERLTAIEKRFHWRPQTGLDVVARLEKLGGAVLSLKELELGLPTTAGPLDGRIEAFTRGCAERAERRYLGKPFDGWAMERIRRLRQLLTRKLLDGAADGEPIKADLEVLLFCENILGVSTAYMLERPDVERRAETFLRLEETLSDAMDMPLGPMAADVLIGPPIDVRAAEEKRARGPDPLIAALRGAMQGCLDQLLTEGPDPSWGCPSKGGPVAKRDERTKTEDGPG